MSKQIILFVVIFYITSLNVQSQNLIVNEFTIEDGLSQTVSTSLLQDNFGFIWVGTEDGLNRFDGYGFKHFMHDPLNSNSLCHNFITCLMQDSKDRIWIGTRKGLSIYNPVYQSFQSYFFDKEDSLTLNHSSILTIFQSSNEEIYIGTVTGFNKVVENRHDSLISFVRFKTSEIPDSTSVLRGAVHNIIEDNSKNLWLAIQSKDKSTNKDIGTLSSYDFNSKKFSHFFYFDNNRDGLQTKALKSLHFENNNLWVGTFHDGLIKAVISTENKIKVEDDNYRWNSTSSPIQHNLINVITGDKKTIWIGTYEGLSSIDKGSNKVKNHPLTNKRNEVFQSLKINDLLIDNSENLWIASVNGLFHYIKSQENFESFTRKPDDQNSILGGDIFSICEDSYGNIWAASYGSGLNKISLTNSEKFIVEKYVAGKRGLKSGQILRIKEDYENNIWLATFDGLSRIINTNKNNPIFEYFTPDNSNLSTRYYYDLFIHSPNKLIGITYQTGIDMIKFNSSGLNVRNYKYTFTNSNEDKIISCFIDNLNQLWIITNRALVNGFINQNFELEFRLIDFPKDQWEKFREHLFFNFNRINKNTLLVGTNTGLLMINFEKSIEENLYKVLELKILTTNNGLPNNTVYAIAGDKKNNYWLSTNKGISKFSLENERFINYEVAGDLKMNEFNAGSVEIGKKGHIYFGGVGGFIRFHPDSIKLNTFIPQIVLTDIKLFNQSININSGKKVILEKSILYQKQIELAYSDNMITFEFAVINFDQPEKNNYFYMLEGLQSYWVNSGTGRQATFTKLNNGKYTFRVKAVNNYGIWSSRETSIILIVNPPPWKTWWAYSFYGLLFISCVVLLLKIRDREIKREIEVTRKIEAAKAEERIKVRSKTSQDFHDEAGNKLTKITLFTSLAKKAAKENPILEEYLTKIQENTKELSNGMRDFLWVLDVGKDSLFDMLKRIEDFGNSMFEPTEIRFTVKGIDQKFKQLILPMEVRRSLILIFKEAINNSFKYSKAKNVFINIDYENDFLEINLVDDGIGFELGEKSNGYGLKNMTARAEKLNGTLQIISSKAKGTKIKLRCNITQMGN